MNKFYNYKIVNINKKQVKEGQANCKAKTLYAIKIVV